MKNSIHIHSNFRFESCHDFKMDFNDGIASPWAVKSIYDYFYFCDYIRLFESHHGVRRY